MVKKIIMSLCCFFSYIVASEQQRAFFGEKQHESGVQNAPKKWRNYKRSGAEQPPSYDASIGMRTLGDEIADFVDKHKNIRRDELRQSVLLDNIRCIKEHIPGNISHKKILDTYVFTCNCDIRDTISFFID